MNDYLIHFAIYSFAMIGFIVIALFVYKKSVYVSGINKDKNFLSVENTLKLSPAKTLYVIKAGSEKFLIAGDAGSTTMLSKLEKNRSYDSFEIFTQNSNVSEIPSLKKYAKKVSKG